METQNDIIVNYHGEFDQEYVHGLARIVLAIEFEYRRALMELVASTPEKLEILKNEVIRQYREAKAKGKDQWADGVSEDFQCSGYAATIRYALHVNSVRDWSEPSKSPMKYGTKPIFAATMTARVNLSPQSH